MILFDLLRVVHLSAFALLITSVAGGWVLQRQLATTGDHRSQALLANAIRPLGLLSPAAITLLLLSGIGQMVQFGLGPFSEAWLLLKLLFFLAAATLGIIGGPLSGARTALMAKGAESPLMPDDERRLRAIGARLQVFLVMQSLLVFCILVLSIIKPGR